MLDLKLEAVLCGLGVSVIAGLATRSYVDKTGQWISWKTPLRQRLITIYVTSVAFASYAAKEWNATVGVVTYIASMVVLTWATNAYNSQDVLGKDKTAPWQHEVAISGAAALGGLVGFVLVRHIMEKVS